MGDALLRLRGGVDAISHAVQGRCDETGGVGGKTFQKFTGGLRGANRGRHRRMNRPRVELGNQLEDAGSGPLITCHDGSLDRGGTTPARQQ